ncbi:MAG TPA: molybdate ABC transporter substrate-binding protein [Alphaproteobacteria bacterium]
MTVHAADAPVIAAASSLNFALADVADLFARETGQTVRLSFGSSGNFVRQIAQGGPFEMFLSADEEYVARLVAQGLTIGRGDVYAVGRIVLFAPDGAPFEPDPEMNGLREAVLSGRVRRLAIANPELAPYGRAARESLMHKGLWDSFKDRLVLGENVSQAAQFATSGSADGGIFAYSLALSPNVAGRGRFVLLPEHLHAPLRQRMVLMRRAGDVAKRFYGFVQQPAAREIFARYGFQPPRPGE